MMAATGAPRARLAGMLAAALLTACIELSGPTDGVESLSNVIPPYPAVIAGDTLRDSIGNAQRLEVVAFSGRGDTVEAPTGLRFLLPDTGTGATISDGYLIAGQKLGPVRVVAQVPGLQTQAVTIEVVPPPTAVRAEPATLGNPATLAATRYAFPGDTLATSGSMQVRVLSAAGEGAPVDVNGWLVTYRIVTHPASSLASGLAAYLVDEGGRAVRADSTFAVDTTANGLASRRVAVRTLTLLEPIDTVEVEARVTFRGQHVSGSPILFRVPFAPNP